MDLVEAQLELDRKIGQVSIRELHVIARSVEVHPEKKPNILVQFLRALKILVFTLLFTVGIMK